MQGSGKVLDLATPLHPERSGNTDSPTHTHTQAHKAARRPASERTRRAEPTGPAEARARLRAPRPSPPRLSPALPSASSPAARPQGSAGRGGARAGRGGPGGAGPKGGVAGLRSQICERGADCAREKASGSPAPEEPRVLARPGPAPRYGAPLGPSPGSLLQSGRCRPPHRLLEQFKPQVSPESPAHRLGARLALLTPGYWPGRPRPESWEVTRGGAGRGGVP